MTLSPRATIASACQPSFITSCRPHAIHDSITTHHQHSPFHFPSRSIAPRLLVAAPPQRPQTAAAEERDLRHNQQLRSLPNTLTSRRATPAGPEQRQQHSCFTVSPTRRVQEVQSCSWACALASNHRAAFTALILKSSPPNRERSPAGAACGKHQIIGGHTVETTSCIAALRAGPKNSLVAAVAVLHVLSQTSSSRSGRTVQRGTASKQVSSSQPHSHSYVPRPSSRLVVPCALHGHC